MCRDRLVYAVIGYVPLRLGGVPFLMIVKLSATVWNLECRSVSSGVDHLKSNNASEVYKYVVQQAAVRQQALASSS